VTECDIQDEGRERRIRSYQERAAAGLPLFGDDDAPAQRAKCTEWECLGCGAACRFGFRFCLPPGWASRTVPTTMGPMKEIHCPDCLRAWGYGDLFPELDYFLCGKTAGTRKATEVTHERGLRACPADGHRV
jgi:hypothetical protein